MGWLFAKRTRSLVLLAALASLVLNVALLGPAIYMMQVFDRVFASRSVETLVMLGAVTLLFLALAFALDTVRVRALAWAGRSLEGKLASCAIRGSIEHAASTPGGADADVLRDISQLRAFLSGPGVLALFDAPWLPIYLLIIALMHPALGLVAGIGACALVALCALTHRLTQAQSEQALTRSRASMRLAERLMRNAEVIVAMGMSTTAVGRWSEQHERLLSAQERQVRASSLLAALARSMRQVVQVAMLGLGAWLVVEQEATAGVMIAATVLLSRALQPIEYLIGEWRATLDVRGAWRRLSGRATGERTKSTVALPAPSGRIEVERLTYAPSATRPPVICNMSFSLATGESLGVIGASACGKTTLMRLMLGLWRPQIGLVRLDGADVSRWDRDALGRYIGYLPQDVELFAGTVGENIARFADAAGTAHSASIVRAAELALAHELILKLPDGYDTQIGERGAALSGGQRQRIALARALYGNPRFVVLDEPDTHLDTAGAAALLAVLTALKSRGVTVVAVSHNATLMAAVDKVAYLRTGVLEMFGPSAAVLARLQLTSSTPTNGASHEVTRLHAANAERRRSHEHC